MTNPTPKFRAWHKRLKVMYQVIRLGLIKEDNYCLVGTFDPHNGLHTTELKGLQNVELLQWTYNVDKNKKDIYVGDIILLGGQNIFYISIFRGTYIISSRQRNFIHNDKLLADFKSSEIEIIGNIYETPEYLDEKCAGVSKLNSDGWK